MKIKASKIIGAAGGISAAFCGVCYLTFREVMHRNAKLPPAIFKIANAAMAKKAPQAAAERDERLVWFEQQHFDEFTLESDTGARLRGYLLKADNPSNVYVFCSHGYRSCGKVEFNRMAKYHHDRGRNIFLVDHQAAGESEGTYIGFGYREHPDCMKWLTFLTETFGKDIQIILHGVSMGCATITLMCGDAALPDNVKFAIADCGYTSAENEFKYVLGGAHIPAFPLINGFDFFNKLCSGFSIKDIQPIESVAHAKVPMLFIHGKTDTFVPTFMATELFNACSSEHKELLLVDGAWHAESYLKNTAGYEEKVDEFADRFISREAAVS